MKAPDCSLPLVERQANDVRDNCAESTQCRDEAELSDLLAEAEAEIDAPQVQLALRTINGSFDGNLRADQTEQHHRKNAHSHHSSLR